MGFFDDAKDKAKDAKEGLDEKVNDLESKFHEKKGEMQGRHDQAEADKAIDEDDEYEPEEKQV